MGQAVAYDDVPAGFQVGGQPQSYDDVPAGFSVGGTPPSTGMDVAKTIGSNLVQGAVAMPMVIPNLVNGLVAGPQLLGRGIAENADKLIGIDPQPRGDLWQPFNSSAYVVNKAGLDYTPQTIPGKIAEIPAQLAGGALAAKGLQSVVPKLGELWADQSSGAPPDSPQVTAADIRDMAKQSYAAADAKGGTLKSNVTDNFVNSAGQVLPQTPAGRLILGDTSTTKLVDNLQSLKGNPLSLAEAQEIDSTLSDKMQSEVDPKTGRLNAEGNKLLQIQSSLRDAIENASPNDVVGGKDGFDAWNQGRQLWSQASRMGDVERIMTRASMMENPVTSIKTGFRTLYNNPTAMRGFTPVEADAIKSAAETGIVGNALRLASSRLVPIIAGSTGGGISGAAVGYGINEGARSLGNSMQMNKANAIIDAIANRPIGQSATPTLPPNAQPAINPNASPVLAGTAGAMTAQMPPPQPLQQQPPSQPAVPVVQPLSPQPQAAATPLINRIAQAESGGNPAAQNPNSSASGPLQFTNSTWANMVAKYGKQTGITLAQKNDPQAQTTMGQLLAQDNAKIMTSKLGRPPTDGELYAAHFFGAPDVMKLINATQNTPTKAAILLYPRKLVNDNRSIFFDGNRPRSVSEVYALLNSKVAS